MGGRLRTDSASQTLDLDIDIFSIRFENREAVERWGNALVRSRVESIFDLAVCTTSCIGGSDYICNEFVSPSLSADGLFRVCLD
jgi:hypothetical protein